MGYREIRDQQGMSDMDHLAARIPVETGDDMGGKSNAEAMNTFEQHKKAKPELHQGLDISDGCHSAYRQEKLEETGYPGLGPSTSQADIMMAKASEPSMYGMGGGGMAGQMHPMYPPHKFQPTQHGLIGAPCAVCMGLPGGPLHITDEPDPLPVGQIRVQALNDKVAGCIRIEVDNAPNEVSRRVLLQILPGLLELYLNKSKDYGDDEETGDDLGPKAAFVDMFRKMKKLRRALWDGVELEGEGPEEIMQDLVGHIFIILDKMARESHGS